MSVHGWDIIHGKGEKEPAKYRTTRQEARDQGGARLPKDLHYPHDLKVPGFLLEISPPQDCHTGDQASLT